MYGNVIQSPVYRPNRDVIGEVDVSMTGNVILRIGKEDDQGSWSQTAYIVLSRDEAQAMMDEVYMKMLETR